MLSEYLNSRDIQKQRLVVAYIKDSFSREKRLNKISSHRYSSNYSHSIDLSHY